MFTTKHINLFWQKVNFDGPLPDQSVPAYMGLGKCFSWTAFVAPNGYGQGQMDGLQSGAHRLAWMIHHQTKIPKKMCILHKCDNRKCVNPDHLILGTQADNIADRDQKDRHNPATGKNHGKYTKPESNLKGENHGRAKLTNAQVLEIYQLKASEPITNLELAARFNIGSSSISLILSGKNWKHLFTNINYK